MCAHVHSVSECVPFIVYTISSVAVKQTTMTLLKEHAHVCSPVC